MSATAPRACPRTGRTRAATLAPGAVRPSDLLVAFFAAAVAWLVAAAVAGAVAIAGDAADAGWLALHLAFVGGISQLVLGAAQFFVCAFLATDPPPQRMVRAQLAVWNAGTLAIAIGVPTEITPLTGAGGTLVVAGLVLFALSLRGMQRRSLQTARWAARWYYAAALSLGVGALLGPVMAADAMWTHGSLLAAHLVLNLGGWFGTAIVGTLHTFHPSLTGTQLRRPEFQPPAFWCWTGGTAALAVACAFSVDALAVAGWAALAAAGALLAVNVVAGERAATQRSLPGALIAAAQALLIAALAVGLVLSATDGASAPLVGADREALAVLAVAGWIGLTVLGSLLHLLGLMGRVRAIGRPGGPRIPPAAPARTFPAWPALLAAALVAVLAATRLADAGAASQVAAAAVALLYLGLGARVVVLAVRAVRAAPLRI